MNASGTAQPGDVLVLGKPLGIGVCSAAPKREGLSPRGRAAMLASTAGPPRIVVR
jgi:selenide,water dikinase